MKWISVNDRLPKEYKDVLVLMDNGFMQVGYLYEKIDGSFGWDTCGNVVYWRKLPNRPNKSFLV